MNSPIKQLTINYEHTDAKEEFLKKLLPVLLFLSFVWLNLYTELAQAVAISVNYSTGSYSLTYVILELLFLSAISYLVFELVFFVYKFLIRFSIYTFMIPRQVLQNRFRLWMIVRNVLLGIIFNLRFFYPYIAIYLSIFDVLFTMLFAVCVYFNLAKKYVDPLVGHFLFRALSVWIAIYEGIEVLFLVLRVL